jgi:glutamate decarboxylase
MSIGFLRAIGDDLMDRWHRHPHPRHLAENISVHPLFGGPDNAAVPRFRIPESGLSAAAAYQIVHDEMALDGSAKLNLATFVSTWMEREAREIYAEAAEKNMIDKDEYPQTAAVEDRCIHILADLWHASDPHTAVGVSTTGSSEACMLGGLALKRRWQGARRAGGRSTARPNIVFSSAVQVVWEKFANYFEVEPRYVEVTPERPWLTPEGVLSQVDENTIGVVPVLGVTYTGVYEPVEEIAAALDDFQERTGLDIPIHVDAASGGFVAPFLQPDLVWDFRLARVQSVNTSGHKYGLVFPGLGWIIWRDRAALPEDLVFRVSYLGGSMPTFGLNFSRPGAQVLLQYYNFLRLGREGYRRVQARSREVARMLAQAIGAMPMFELLSDGSHLPVLAWRRSRAASPHWDLYDLSHLLRERGWQVPAYPLPKAMEDTTIMRVVVRDSLTPDLGRLLLEDIERAVAHLEHLDGPFPHELRGGRSFAH